MPKPQIVLNMYGGVVQEVFCSDPDVNLVLVDWDTETNLPSEHGIVEVQTAKGRTHLAWVQEMLVHPFKDLAGTDVEAALKKAEVYYGQT